MTAESGQPYRGIGTRKARSEKHLFTVLVAVVLGFAGAAGAIVFRILIRLFLAGPRQAVDNLERL